LVGFIENFLIGDGILSRIKVLSCFG